MEFRMCRDWPSFQPSSPLVPLVIEALDWVETPSEGVERRIASICPPSWADVRKAVAGLDRDLRPVVRLRVRRQLEDRGYLAIAGGRGAYGMGGTNLDRKHYYFYDSRKSDGRIVVLPGEGSYAPEEHYVCTDIGDVLEAAAYFARFGHFLADLPWSTYHAGPPEPDAAEVDPDPYTQWQKRWEVVQSRLPRN